MDVTLAHQLVVLITRSQYKRGIATEEYANLIAWHGGKPDVAVFKGWYWNGLPVSDSMEYSLETLGN